MRSVRDEILAANAAYARSLAPRPPLPMRPARRLAVLTCMDARMDPAAFLGLREGDAHVIRNAGGRASDDAIRSLVLSHKLLGTEEWLVIHHPGCGMETVTDQILRELFARSLEPAVYERGGWRDVGEGPGSHEAEFIDWLTIQDPERAVVTDVRRLRFHPLVPPGVAIHGFLYDVSTGRLREVEAAGRIGRADRETEEHLEAAGDGELQPSG